MRIRTRFRPPRGRNGFTLLEMVVVLWGLAILLAIGSLTLIGLMRIQQANAQTHERLVQRSALADQFRADVARAADAPASLDKLKAGPDCLILRLADGKHVVYRWKGDQLEWTELAGSGENRHPLPVGPDPLAIEFSRTGPGERIITLRLRESRDDVRGARSLEISAALGGDLR